MTDKAGSKGHVPEVNPENEFQPGADPKKWIEQHAGPYRERPSAVLRELIQNANDAFRQDAGEQRFAEIAILNRGLELGDGHYHLCIRDSGSGMDEREFKQNVGTLGVSTKQGSFMIGEFGVGFYSTHAICDDVAVLSKKQGIERITAWRYHPADKMFYRLDPSVVERFLGLDFENHPMASRRRESGTSVYLKLDLRRYPACSDWLMGASLALELKRDIIILPTSVFVSDFSDNPSGAPILDFHRRDVRDVSLSLVKAPWDLEGAQQKAVIHELFKAALPYTPENEHPAEWSCFKRNVDGGQVCGFLFVVKNAHKSFIELFLKRMRVETAEDVKPICFQSVFGYIDLTPHPESLAVSVLAARDHIVRDRHFDTVRTAIEDACAEFYAKLGTGLERNVAQAVQANPDPETLSSAVSGALNRSCFFELLCDLKLRYDNLFMDIPKVLLEIIGEPDCAEDIKEATLKFVKRHVPEGVASLGALPTILKGLDGTTEEEARKERESAASTGTRVQLEWNPRASKLFFEKVGHYLPISVHRKEHVRHGGFQVSAVTIPLAMLKYLDPNSTAAINVLTLGRPEDFFSKHQDIRTVIVPRNEYEILMLATVSRLNTDQYPLRFVRYTRNLFTDLTVKDEWAPLVELFKSILGRQHLHSPGEPELDVDARGYKPDHIPLVITVEGNKSILVINGYNELLQKILVAFGRSNAVNDREGVETIASICHELYHHAQLAEAEGGGEDLHRIETRSKLFADFLSILQKYNDLKR